MARTRAGHGGGPAALDRRPHVVVWPPSRLPSGICPDAFLSQSQWIGDRLADGASRGAPLMRPFLAATAPPVLSVPVRMAIGLNEFKIIAMAAPGGSLVDPPVRSGLTGRGWGPRT